MNDVLRDGPASFLPMHDLRYSDQVTRWRVRLCACLGKPMEPLHNLSGKRALRIGMGCKAANRSDSRSYCEDLQHRRPPESADASGAVDYAEVPYSNAVPVRAVRSSL